MWAHVGARVAARARCSQPQASTHTAHPRLTTHDRLGAHLLERGLAARAAPRGLAPAHDGARRTVSGSTWKAGMRGRGSTGEGSGRG